MLAYPGALHVVMASTDDVINTRVKMSAAEAVELAVIFTLALLVGGDCMATYRLPPSLCLTSEDQAQFANQ